MELTEKVPSSQLTISSYLVIWESVNVSVIGVGTKSKNKGSAWTFETFVKNDRKINRHLGHHENANTTSYIPSIDSLFSFKQSGWPSNALELASVLQAHSNCSSTQDEKNEQNQQVKQVINRLMSLADIITINHTVLLLFVSKYLINFRWFFSLTSLSCKFILKITSFSPGIVENISSTK